jgi:hypothetical protein
MSHEKTVSEALAKSRAFANRHFVNKFDYCVLKIDIKDQYPYHITFTVGNYNPTYEWTHANPSLWTRWYFQDLPTLQTELETWGFEQTAPSLWQRARPAQMPEGFPELPK